MFRVVQYNFFTFVTRSLMIQPYCCLPHVLLDDNRNNCHDYVCEALNELKYKNTKWNNVNLALGFLIHGKFVNTGAMLKTWLPFIIFSVILLVIVICCCV